MNLSVILLALCVTFDNAASENMNSKVTKYVSEEQPKGTPVANMARIFSLRYEERPGRTFKLLSQKLVTRNPNTSKRNVELVQLDPSTGVITPVEQLDREKICGSAEECSIYVQAVMLPQQYFTMLNLELKIEDINDNAPEFPVRRINVTVTERETAVGDVINLDQFRAYDKDIGENGRIYYELSANDYFKASQYEDEAGTSHLQLKVLKTPDHEITPLHKFTLTATDGGADERSDQVEAYIYVADANDHDPIFDSQEYSVDLQENRGRSSLVTTVHATDQDSGVYGQVRYFIPPPDKSSSGVDLVAIDERTGEIRLKKKLDRETHDGVRILVEARDSDPEKPRVGKTWLVIHVDDVNDNAPVINVNYIIDSINQTGYILESEGTKTYVAYVGATDADNGPNGDVTISIETFAKKQFIQSLVPLQNQFVLASDGLVATGRQLDREVYQYYLIRIKACDDGSPRRCTSKNITIVVLDVNDHVPKFDSKAHIVTIAENTMVGAVVTKVKASDKDAEHPPALWKNKDKVIEASQNGVIRYSIAEGNLNYFKINPATGEIRLQKALDHEKRSTWKLVINARDGGWPKSLSSNCTVTIRVGDINDNPPIFIRPKANNTHVYATILNDQLIMAIRAQDFDKGLNSKIGYKILQEDGKEIRSDVKAKPIFVINPITGDLRLNFSNANLTDFLGWHTVLIEVRDSGYPTLSATTLIQVKVTNEALPNPLNQAGLDQSLILIVAILGVASLLLVVIIIIVLCKRRQNRRQKSHTYNCRTAEHKGKAWITPPRDLTSGDDSASKTPPFTQQKPINTSTEESSNRRNDAIVVQSQANGSDRTQNGTSTFKGGEKMNRAHLVLPITSCNDRDSGRGDSDPENGNFDPQEETVTHEQVRRNVVVRMAHSQNSQQDDESNRTSELGPRCDESCREYGHSDTCWMPSPGKDNYLPPNLTNQRASQALTSSTPQLDYYRHYDASDYGDHRVQEYPTLQHYATGNYCVPHTENYYPAMVRPSQYNEIYYHGFGGELETIEEVLPLRGHNQLGADDTNYISSDVDDVSVHTQMALSTALSPSERNTAPIHVHASRGSLAGTEREQHQYQNVPAWNPNYYNPPAVQRTPIVYGQTQIVHAHQSSTASPPPPKSRLSSCSSDNSALRSTPANISPQKHLVASRSGTNYATSRLTPAPQLSDLSADCNDPYHSYHNSVTDKQANHGAVTMQEAQEIISDIDKLLQNQ